MAYGDVAASIGIPTVPDEDIRLGRDEMNRILDVIAGHFISGTHPADAIDSGTLDPDRIPNLDASVIATGTLLAAVIPALAASIITSGTFNVARIPNLSAAKITSGNLDLGGIGFVRGSSLVTPGDLTAAGVRSTIITSGIQAVYARTDGVIGVTSSSARFKQDIAPAEQRTRAFMALEVVNFRYIAEVEDEGDAAPIQRGVIAEQLHAIGLTEYVVYNDGAPFSVHYERLVLDVIPVVQDHERRLAAIEGNA